MTTDDHGIGDRMQVIWVAADHAPPWWDGEAEGADPPVGTGPAPISGTVPAEPTGYAPVAWDTTTASPGDGEDV
jgi:hypothetical protein